MKQLLVSLLWILLVVSCKKNGEEISKSPILAGQNLYDIAYGSNPLQKMDVYLPEGRSTDSTPMMILIHGGAWSSGDKADFNQFVPILQQRFKGYAFANMNYRLATSANNHFPAQEQDMKAAVDFLVQKSFSYHFSNNFILLGASSGGHQATLQAYKYPQPRIRAVIDFFAPVDMKELFDDATPGSLNQLAIQILVGGTPTSNPLSYEQSSPVHFVTALSPPTIILHGDMDAIVKVSQSRSLKNQLDKMGVANELVIYPGMGHAIWPTDIMNDAFMRIETFVKAHVR